MFDDDAEVNPTRMKKPAITMDLAHVDLVVKVCIVFDLAAKKIIIDQVKLQINISCNNNIIGRS
jgi:hypothetical protein